MDMLMIVYMRYKLLGKSGLRVSELCLGGMTFGEDWGSMLPGASKEEAKKIFDIFVNKGGNFIDTANVYQMGTSASNSILLFWLTTHLSFLWVESSPFSIL
jgi:aryl-alcohol dehydrogenase-like predicted oxidoreductase